MTRARSIAIPLFLLALLLAGGGAHAWHHLLDPHCESGRASHSHPCVSCSALHGATAAEIGAGIAVPVAPGRDLPAQPEHVAPHAFAAGTPGTRAPPRA